MISITEGEKDNFFSQISHIIAVVNESDDLVVTGKVGQRRTPL